jgi:TM2 domain-containing membrane protein YozV
MRVSLFWAYMMLIFFGCIGLHKLYMGKIAWAIVYALTGGLFFIGIIWDLFTLPAQVIAVNYGRS